MNLRIIKRVIFSAMVVIASGVFLSQQAYSCTGIKLTSVDGSVVYGRTMEWGAFDLNTRIGIIPVGYKFIGLTPDGLNGMKWTAKYGAVSLDMIGRDIGADGMNEKGLVVGLYYHPGFASYPKYNASKSNITISAVDFTNFILTQFVTVNEVINGLKKVRVVPVNEEVLGDRPVDAHWMVTDTKGTSIVIEFTEGKLKIHENPLGVITNAPNYDWHMTNMRNYVNLSAVAMPSKKIEDLNFAALGAGSGMIGLPGDFTPPSRFTRAVAWSQTARKTKNSSETVYELFRILDSFNVPLGSAEGSDHEGDTKGMRSATLFTTSWDLDKRILYYHTQHNRRVRMLDLKRINFSKNSKKITHIPLDDNKEQDFKDITPEN